MGFFKRGWGFYALSAILLNVLGVVIYSNFADVCSPPTTAQRQGMQIGSLVIACGLVTGVFCLFRLFLDLLKNNTKKSFFLQEF